MHLPPFLSLSTSFRSRSPKSNDFSPSTSTTTSPPSSPTSNHSTYNSPHFSNLGLHPSKPFTHTPRGRRPENREQENCDTTEPSRVRPASDIIPHSHNAHNGMGIPDAVLRGRSSMMVLRRRMSKIDMALSEEQTRCDEDSIERQGLGLMEPRPIDRVGEVQPNCVMGGIFEVMEGRA